MAFVTDTLQVFLLGIFVFYFVIIQVKTDLGPISEREKPLIKQLRERVKSDLTLPVMYEDDYLVRYIRAQDYSLVDAEQMVRRMLIWRQQENMDNILSEDWSEWLKNYPFTLNLTDHIGKKTLISRIGKIDLRRIALGGQSSMLNRYITYGYERAIYNVHNTWTKTGHIDGHLLFNMGGYSARTHACLACIPMWVSMVSNYENYYPRLGDKIYVVNAPRIFQTLFNALKPFLTSYTLQRVVLYDYNKAVWTQELFKDFPEENLPLEYGGTGTVPKIISLHDQNYRKFMFYNTTRL